MLSLEVIWKEAWSAVKSQTNWTLKKVCIAKGYFCNLVTHSLKWFAFFRLSCRESFRRWTPCQRWRPLRGSTCRPHPVAFMSHQLTVGTDTVNSFGQSCSLFNLLHASLGRHNGIHLFCDVQPPGRLLKGWSGIALPVKAAIVTFSLMHDHYCLKLL